MTHAESYARAAYEEIANGEKLAAVLKRVSRVLERRGHQKLYRRMLKALLREATRNAASRAPVVSIARADDAQTLQREIAETLANLGAGEAPVVEINETLIGGFAVRHQSTYIDASYKRKLLTLYRTITR